jgi:hypothetical protein
MRVRRHDPREAGYVRSGLEVPTARNSDFGRFPIAFER